MVKASAKDKIEESLPSKSKSSTTTATNASRGRKTASNSKDVAVANSSASKTASASHGTGSSNTISGSTVSPWANAPLETLHSYRSFHRLKIPASYCNPHSHHILGHGIGRQTPTAAGVRKEKRRSHRESLSMAVRKHFNASAVNENDAIVNTLYRARTGEKSLRLKFLPLSKQR